MAGFDAAVRLGNVGVSAKLHCPQNCSANCGYLVVGNGFNRHMEHRLVPDEGNQDVSDAIAVARLLGMDLGVSKRADHYFKESNRVQE